MSTNNLNENHEQVVIHLTKDMDVLPKITPKIYKLELASDFPFNTLRLYAEEINKVLGFYHNQDYPSLFPIDEATQTVRLYDAPEGIAIEHRSPSDFPDTISIPLLDYNNRARLTLGLPIAFDNKPDPNLLALLSNGAILDIYTFIGAPFHFVLFENGRIVALRSSIDSYENYKGSWDTFHQTLNGFTGLKDFSVFREQNAFVLVGVLQDGTLDVRHFEISTSRKTRSYPFTEMLRGLDGIKKIVHNEMLTGHDIMITPDLGFVVCKNNKVYQLKAKGLSKKSWGNFGKVVFISSGRRYVILDNGKLLFDEHPIRGVDFKKFVIKDHDMIILSKRGELYSPRATDIFDGKIKDFLVVPESGRFNHKIFILNENGKLFVTNYSFSLISRIEHTFENIFYSDGAIHGKLLQRNIDSDAPHLTQHPPKKVAKGIFLDEKKLTDKMSYATDKIGGIIKNLEIVWGGATTITFLLSDALKLNNSNEFWKLLKEYQLEDAWRVTLEFSSFRYKFDRFPNLPPDRDIQESDFNGWAASKQQAIDVCRLAALLESLNLKIFHALINYDYYKLGDSPISHELKFGNKDFSKDYMYGSSYDRDMLRSFSG